MPTLLWWKKQISIALIFDLSEFFFDEEWHIQPRFIALLKIQGPLCADF